MSDETVQLHVDAEACIAGGQCEMLEPEVFEIDEDTAVAVIIGDGMVSKDRAEILMDRCPSGAITINDRAATTTATAMTTAATTPFVPENFEIPAPLVGPGWRLEPLGPEHNEGDYAAWTSSIDFIRALPGFDEWDEWPPDEMSLEANRGDLVMHAEEFEAREAFAYSVLEQAGGGGAESVVGCLYINTTRPDKRPYQVGHDAQIRSWVRADRPDLDRELWAAVSAWLSESWPFANPRYHQR